MKFSQTLLVFFATLCVLERVEAAPKSPPLDLVQSVRVVQGRVAADPVTFVNSNLLDGTLTYSYLISYAQKEAAIAIRSFVGKQESTQTYVFTLNGVAENGIFDCQRSTNGEYIAFKYGSSFGEYVSYTLYLFNTRTQRVRAVSEKDLQFKNYAFSPDGKFIFYVRGGNHFGMTDTPNSKPLSLLSYDIEKASGEVVPTKTFVPLSVTWSQRHTLLFSAQAKADQHPDLYSYVAGEGMTSLVAKDCYRAVLSSDGKKIAFFGSENPAKPLSLNSRWPFVSKYLALTVSDADGSNRVALDVKKGIYPTLFWSLSGRSLYEFNQATSGSTTTAIITEWDVASGRKQEVARLLAKDFEATSRDELDPSIYFVGLSADRSHVLAVAEESTGKSPDGAMLIVSQELRLVDLTTGKAQVVATSNKILSYDWSSAN